MAIDLITAQTRDEQDVITWVRQYRRGYYANHDLFLADLADDLGMTAWTYRDGEFVDMDLDDAEGGFQVYRTRVEGLEDAELQALIDIIFAPYTDFD